MKDIVLKYKKAGLSCLPTKENKSPSVSKWRDVDIDIKDFEGAYGIGVICGKQSDNLECFDFDNHFGDAKENISNFLKNEVKEIYDKYKLPIIATKNGGYHLLYRCDDIEGNQKLASRPKIENGKFRPDAIIETRGEGGYFVTDPTPGYKTIRNSILDIQYISKDDREILISTAKSFNTWHDKIQTEFETTERPGDLFNRKTESLDEMRKSLLNAGWEEIRDGFWRRPGKKDGISATLGRVAENIFYNFSSNSYPFEVDKAYTAFQVISLLDYNGDFSSFAKELSDRYDMNKKVINQPPKEKKTKNELDSIINFALIDLNVPVEKPPIIMRIRQKVMKNGALDVLDTRLFTLGNFSAITGKGKSKKTFLTTLLLATSVDNGLFQNKFISDIPLNKSGILLFDTEQSKYDAYITGIRIPKLIGHDCQNLGVFSLREYSYKDRCDIIEQIIKRLNGTVSYIVIDGIADLAKAINDEEEATRVVGLLMRWTKEYNCHITTVIHQNKNDNYATGHLGSSVIKKSECVISVEKDETDFNRSHVKCDMMRGTFDFKDFDFYIDENGLPRIDNSTTYNIDEKF